MFCTNNKNCNESQKIRNVDVSRVSCAKFLGMNTAENLNFKCHLNNVFKTASKSCGIIYKLHNILPEFILRKIYMVSFYPHLTYAETVWGQNKCLKYVYKNQPFQNSNLYNEY